MDVIERGIYSLIRKKQWSRTESSTDKTVGWEVHTREMFVLWSSNTNRISAAQWPILRK